MIYLIWSLPAIAVVLALVSGKANALVASAIGVIVALAVALAAGPRHFDIAEAGLFLARGAWIGWIVVPYILGGLLLWQVAMRRGDAAMPVETTINDEHARRRLLFTACYLIGPFAEAATGFGIGIIGTMLLIRRLQMPTVYLLALSLLSQTMILWGGMGSGAIVAAAYAKTDATALVVHASIFYLAFNLVWLPLYWMVAERAGIHASWRERLSELAWLGSAQGLAIGASQLLGPETALLAAYAPLIVLRYLLDEKPDKKHLLAAMGRMAPFAILICWFVISRLTPPVKVFLEGIGRLQPFERAPAWSPMYHAGTWLLFAAVATAICHGRLHTFGTEWRAAWKTGRLAVLTIILFSMMAELLSGSGIASGLAAGMFTGLGQWAVVVTPFVSAVFGSLANSGNAANGLFMASQVRLANDASLNVGAVIALQHAAALSLNMISPVRMSIVCGLGHAAGKERELYRIMLPFAAGAMGVLLLAALIIASRAY